MPTRQLPFSDRGLSLDALTGPIKAGQRVRSSSSIWLTLRYQVAVESVGVFRLVLQLSGFTVRGR